MAILHDCVKACAAEPVRKGERDGPDPNLKVPPSAEVACLRLSPPPGAGGGRRRGRAGGGPWGVRRHGVPGVELLAVEESPHVMVAHEVAAAYRARTLVRHEAPLDLKLGVHTQARHGCRLPGHPEQQQEQRPGSPAPGPERHRTAWTGGVRRNAGRAAALQTWKGFPASPGPQRPPPAALVRPQPGRGEEPRLPEGRRAPDFLRLPRVQKPGEDRSDCQALRLILEGPKRRFGNSYVAADPVSPLLIWERKET